MSGHCDTCQILGATTAATCGIAVLPYTGGYPLAELLANVSILAGALVLSNFLITRILKKVIS